MTIMKPSHDTIASVFVVPILGMIGEHSMRVCVRTSADVLGYCDVSLGRVDAELFESIDRYVSSTVNQSLRGLDCRDQERVDASLVVLNSESYDGEVVSPLSTALLACSVACARAGAMSIKTPLYAWLSRFVLDREMTFRCPLPIVPILYGRASGETNLDFREYCIVPTRRMRLRNPINQTEELQRLARVIEQFGLVLGAQGFGSAVGKLGGYVPAIDSTMRVFDLTLEAIRRAGLRPGDEISLGIDLGSSTLFDDRKGEYYFNAEQSFLSKEQMIEMLFTWMETYPITYVQDPLDRDDWGGVVRLRSALDQRARVIRGDSVMVAVQDGIAEGVRSLDHAARVGSCETVVISMKHIRTVSDCIHRVHVARTHRMECVLSGDNQTGDVFAADLAVALNVDAVKFGPLTHSPSRAKYNRLLEIERERGAKN